ncbi:5'-3' exonuclease H3TH domain-containing protein [Granulosicoccaceae sp. 1_MG-2023]|nr:5'-3' exonuclease H3TH domain-containing protein [Granulosicoccaceae sp. 1_MG-2023]
MKTLYLIDSSIYMFRSWHLLPETILTPQNQAANALHGFAAFLLQVTEQAKPTHLVCAFDECYEGSLRKQIYPLYKANRPPAPENLRHQFAWCRELAGLLGFHCLGSPTHEADDIIGTLAGQTREQHDRSVILTADKDLTQFIGPDDIYWDFSRKRQFSYRDIRKRWNLHPSQIADMLALAGDKSDNIPGVPGIGVHTAARLLVKWGDIDNLYAHLGEVADMKFRGAQRVARLVAESREAVYLARRLTGLMPAAGLPQQTEDFRLQQPDFDALGRFWEQTGLPAAHLQRWQRAFAHL